MQNTTFLSSFCSCSSPSSLPLSSSFSPRSSFLSLSLGFRASEPWFQRNFQNFGQSLESSRTDRFSSVGDFLLFAISAGGGLSLNERSKEIAKKYQNVQSFGQFLNIPCPHPFSFQCFFFSVCWNMIFFRLVRFRKERPVVGDFLGNIILAVPPPLLTLPPVVLWRLPFEPSSVHLQRQKNLGSRVAMLPGKFLRVRKVFARIIEKDLLNCLNTFKTIQIFPDDCQFSGLFQNCPDFCRWQPIFRII